MKDFQVLEETATTVKIRLALKEDSPVFEGHFPDLPILPGVVQVQWAMRCSERWYSAQQFWRLDKLKFKQAIVPGDKLILRLEQRENGKVNFTYSADAEDLSSGCLVFKL